MAKTLADIGKEYKEFEPSTDGGILDIIKNWGNELIQGFQKNLFKKRTYQGKRGPYSANAIASGRLYQNIEPSFKSTEKGYKMTVTMMDYWEYVEYGRGKTQGGGSGEVYKNIYQWIMNKPSMQKSIAQSADRIAATKSLAYVITRKIHREGTVAKPFIKPTFKEVTTQTLANRIAKYIADTLGEP